MSAIFIALGLVGIILMLPSSPVPSISEKRVQEILHSIVDNDNDLYERPE